MHPIDFFLRAASRYPNHIALQGPGSVSLTYESLAKQVNTLAYAMQQADPTEQSRVAICAGNTSEHIIALLATLQAGKTWVPLNIRSTAQEVQRILDTVHASIVITDETGASLVNNADVPHRWCIGAARKDWKEIKNVCSPFKNRRPLPIQATREATQAIKFTGGTTGVPKGVMQPYRAWNAGIINQIHGWGLNETDCYVVCAPITHGTSTYLLPILAQGGKLVFPETNSPPAIAKAFRDHQGTISFMPPTLIYMLMAHPDVHVSDFASLRNLVYGGAPMPTEKVDEAVGFFGPRVGATYGQTEAPQIVTMLRPAEVTDPANRGSAGRCTWLSDLAIRSPQGEFLGQGEKGEVVVRGDLVMTGYWQLPEKTAETIRDGWLHTGDVGYVDERGFLFIKDRLRDVVITGGFNVYPVDVEDALSKHPAVYEASVFGWPDPKWGEAVHAAIQLRKDADTTQEALMDHVKALLGGVHTPKYIHFVDQLPRSAVGKVLKKDIKDRLFQTKENP
jgi:acyl-CoA synthetase (AMP-forming)/AMP-acid ligase II